jgi:hypothetical protein
MTQSEVYRSRLLGTLWFATCACLGTLLIAFSFSQRRTLSEALFPLFLALWAVVFLCGRALLASVMSKRSHPPTETKSEVNKPEISATPEWRKNIRPQLTNLSDGRCFYGNLDYSTPRKSYPTVLLPRTSLNPLDLGTTQIASLKWPRPEQPMFAQTKTEKNVWRGFHVVSADSILQGIVTSTIGRDILTVEENRLLIEQVLRRILEGMALGKKEFQSMR